MTEVKKKFCVLQKKMAPAFWQEPLNFSEITLSNQPGTRGKVASQFSAIAGWGLLARRCSGIPNATLSGRRHMPRRNSRQSAFVMTACRSTTIATVVIPFVIINAIVRRRIRNPLGSFIDFDIHHAASVIT